LAGGLVLRAVVSLDANAKNETSSIARHTRTVRLVCRPGKRAVLTAPTGASIDRGTLASEATLSGRANRKQAGHPFLPGLLVVTPNQRGPSHLNAQQEALAPLRCAGLDVLAREG
jgi:hypothetical protein